MTQFVSHAAQLDALPIRSTAAVPFAGREPIKHLLIGSPTAIRHTIHRLHNLHYADAGLWSGLLGLGDRSDTAQPQPILITPNPGDAMSILVRYLTLE
jgi:hypothetical protein